MYDSEDEYSFVVLSRSNSFRKVCEEKNVEKLLPGKNPISRKVNFLFVKVWKVFFLLNFHSNFKFFLSLSLLQPASYGKKVSSRSTLKIKKACAKLNL